MYFGHMLSIIIIPSSSQQSLFQQVSPLCVCVFHCI